VQRGGEALAVLFIDLDGLKTINDTYGHPAGDTAIRALATVLRSTTRRSDVVGRVGGDEFVVARVGDHDLGATDRLAARILEHVATADCSCDRGRIQLGCSIGMATSDGLGVDLDELIRRADTALYRAKMEGRGRAAWFQPVPVENEQVKAPRVET
jgi:diguanylate cyclase (GGDEF)-like protein